MINVYSPLQKVVSWYVVLQSAPVACFISFKEQFSLDLYVPTLLRYLHDFFPKEIYNVQYNEDLCSAIYNYKPKKLLP